MSTIARTRAVVGSLYALMRNALGLNVATPLESQELSCTVAPDRRLVVLGHEPIAGFSRDLGTVADEAAMLALHTLDSTTLLAEPTFVAPGDSCLRADDPGWRWHCISGHGQALPDWERRPLAAVIATLANELDGKADEADLADYAPIASPEFTGEPTAPTPTAGDDSTKIATTAFVAAAVAAGGGGGGGGGLDLTLNLRHWIVGRESDNAALDLVDDTTWTWTGTAATAAGKVARALSFGGASYISRQLSGDHIFQDGFTRISWVKPSALPTGGSFLSCIGVFGVAHTAYQYQYPYSGVHRISGPISIDGVNDASAFTTSSAPLSTSGWTFVAQVYDPLGIAWSWRDADAISGDRASAIRVYQANNTTVFVGAGNTTDARRWNGLIDSWALWTRPLTVPEIVWLWNGGAGRAYGAL